MISGLLAGFFLRGILSKSPTLLTGSMFLGIIDFAIYMNYRAASLYGSAPSNYLSFSEKNILLFYFFLFGFIWLIIGISLREKMLPKKKK